MEATLNTHQVNDKINVKQQVCATLDKGGGELNDKSGELNGWLIY